MSYTGPEDESLPGERWIECSSCECSYFSIHFSDKEDNYDNICNNCYKEEQEEEELSECCGAEIILTDLCGDCKEHI